MTTQPLAPSVGPAGPERLVPPSRSVGAGQAVLRVSPGVTPLSKWPVPPPEAACSFPAPDMHCSCSVSVGFLAVFLKGGFFERWVGTALHRLGGVAGLTPIAELVRGWLLQVGWQAGQKQGVSGNTALRRSLISAELRGRGASGGDQGLGGPGQCLSSVQWLSRVRLFDPMDCSTPYLPVHYLLPSLPKLVSIESVMPSNHLILCHPLLLLPSIFPSIRVFSNESVLCMRWPKYWSFSFNISPSIEHSGIIFRMDWLDLLAVQGTLKSLLQHHSSKASVLCLACFIV